MTQYGPLPEGVPPKTPWGSCLHPTSPRCDSDGEVEKHHPHHDLKGPQERHRLLQIEPRILSQGRLQLLYCWYHGPPILRSRQLHNQADWPLEQQRDAQVSICAGGATHDIFLASHAHAWQIFLSAVLGVVALLLILKISFLFLQPVLLATLPTLCPMAYGDSEPSHGIKLAA